MKNQAIVVRKYGGSSVLKLENTEIDEPERNEILLRQIAGFMAKRIVNYVEIGEEVEQGTDMGFIKFGSRVDLYLPLVAKMEIEIGQKVKGNKTVIARL